MLSRYIGSIISDESCNVGDHSGTYLFSLMTGGGRTTVPLLL